MCFTCDYHNECEITKNIWSGVFKRNWIYICAFPFHISFSHFNDRCWIIMKTKSKSATNDIQNVRFHTKHIHVNWNCWWCFTQCLQLGQSSPIGIVIFHRVRTTTFWIYFILCSFQFFFIFLIFLLTSKLLQCVEHFGSLYGWH